MIITFDKNAYFFPYINSDENIVVNALKSDFFVWKVLRKIPFISRFAFSPEIKRYSDKVEKIIVFDSAYTPSLAKYISKNKGKIILYIWNPVKNSCAGNAMEWIKKAKKYSQVYSFDVNDCYKYALNLTTSVYSSSVLLKQGELKYDVCFLGTGKGREETLLNLERTVFRSIEKCHFIIVGSKNVNTMKIQFSTRRYNYQEYLDLIAQSKVMLDIPQNGQVGNTMRVMESLFFKKKLITTDSNIKFNDFYNANNIFIIGEDDEDDLVSFINSPYKDIGAEIITKYDFDNWKRLL